MPRSFEQSMQALEDLIKQLENGDLALEDAIKTYEKGIKLSQQCQQTLDQAEQRVKDLTQESNDDKA
ncbi:MAG: exodeoxyribonuclease VII small subunit [Candidatus Comchoanobacterales bacterium]